MPKKKRITIPISAVIEDRQTPLASAETIYLETLGLEFGLGEAIREFQFAKVIRRQFRADIAWPRFMLLLEIEGGIHNNGRHVRAQGYENDCEKYSIASILGYTLIRVTYGMIREGGAYKLLRMAAERKIKCQK